MGFWVLAGMLAWVYLVGLVIILDSVRGDDGFEWQDLAVAVFWPVLLPILWIALRND